MPERRALRHRFLVVLRQCSTATLGLTRQYLRPLFALAAPTNSSVYERPDEANQINTTQNQARRRVPPIDYEIGDKKAREGHDESGSQTPIRAFDVRINNAALQSHTMISLLFCQGDNSLSAVWYSLVVLN